MRIYCRRCGASAAATFQTLCQCGGMIDVEYALDRATLHDSPNPYVRFADLLPIERVHAKLPSEARYTPLIHATRLGRAAGLTALYVKDDTTLPTCSTKDRMAAVALAYLWERGVRSFCTSSTGNSSTAYAHAIRAYPDMHLHLFSAERFVPRVQHAGHVQVTHHCLRGATFVEASDFAVTYARRHGLVAEGGFFNPGRREGLKLAFLEASEQLGRPIDWYVQAVSSAMGVLGAAKGARELQRMGRIERSPRILCVQQQSCAPMAHAYAEGSECILPHHLVAQPDGIAEAILRGDPSRAYPYVRQLVVDSAGDIVAVSEAEIRQARQMVEQLEGLRPCFSASAAVAGVLKQARCGRLAREHTVLINLTGAVREDSAPAGALRWLERDGTDWVAA